MEAVARGKAHWLFRAGTDKLFKGKRPQEDMVTSAVFGSIRLMSQEDRRRAINVVLGEKCFEEAGFAAEDSDIHISLWPRLKGLEDRKFVEPDVLLSCAGKTLIVEVKWHAPLSERQIEQQIDAVNLTKPVSAVVMLGEAGVEEKVRSIPCFRRTWRDVSSELQNWPNNSENAFDRWAETMREFLQETDMGRIFNGMPAPAETDQVTFHFSKPGHPPWMSTAPTAVEIFHYRFQREP